MASRSSKSKPQSPPAPARALTPSWGLTGPIPSEQWNLPVGFKGQGQTLATLAEVVDPNVATQTLADADDERRHELIVERFTRKPDSYRIHLVGAGVVDKARAIEEIKAQTPTGRLLEEIEQRVVNIMITKAMASGGQKHPADVEVTPSKTGDIEAEEISNG